MELVGEEEREVVLVDLGLVAWMVDFRPLGDTFSRFMNFMILSTFYDLFLTDED